MYLQRMLSSQLVLTTRAQEANLSSLHDVVNLFALAWWKLLFLYLFGKEKKSEYGMVPDFEKSTMNWKDDIHTALLSCHNS